MRNRNVEITLWHSAQLWPVFGQQLALALLQHFPSSSCNSAGLQEGSRTVNGGRLPQRGAWSWASLVPRLSHAPARKRVWTNSHQVFMFHTSTFYGVIKRLLKGMSPYIRD